MDMGVVVEGESETIGEAALETDRLEGRVAPGAPGDVGQVLRVEAKAPHRLIIEYTNIQHNITRNNVDARTPTILRVISSSGLI